jgi:SsrA-binding protein
MSLITNKKAHFNYEILDKYEAGIELLGLEVKSVKLGRGSLDGARVIVRGKEAFLVGATIQPYQPENTPKEYDQNRTRRLLLTKNEINELIGKEAERGLTIIPISMYNKGRKIKIEIAVVKGKKKYDKRETIKRRDIEREIGRRIKG